MSKYVKINGKLVEVKDEDVLDTKPVEGEVAVDESVEEEAKKLGSQIAKAVMAGLNLDVKGDKALADLTKRVEGMIDTQSPANSKLKEILKGKDLYGDKSQLTKEEKIVGFFHAMVTQDKAALKALAEGVDADGGYLFPNEFLSELVRDLPRANPLRDVVRVIPMRRDVMDVTTLVSGPEFFYTAENVAKTTTSAHFGRVTLTAYKLAAILYASDELIEDSTEIDLVSTIIQLFSERLAVKEQQAIMVGSGSGQPTGIETARAAGTIASVSGAGKSYFDAVIDVYHALPIQYRSLATWIMSDKMARYLRYIKDTTGQYIWQPAVTAEAPDLLLGRPVVVSDYGPDRTLYFGDWKRAYFLGDRKRLTVKVSQDTETAFTKDQTAIRVVARLAGNVVFGNAARAGITFSA